MSFTRVRPLWRGRALALIGIVLIALNLRTAVAALSPIVDFIDVDVPLSPVVLGILGGAPPVCFAIFGLLAPRMTRRWGLERVLIGALVVMAIGMFWRGFATSAVLLIVPTIAIFAGTAVGNIVLPPLVKKYFPDRVGLMTTIYVSAMAVSTFVPPLVAVPIAATVSWRVSLAQWGMLAVVAIIPWVAVLIRERALRTPTAEVSIVTPDAKLIGTLWRSPMAWSITVLFSCSSLTAYTIFAWLPTLLIETADIAPLDAGALVALFAAMGLPLSMLVPVLTARFHIVRLFVAIAVVGLLGGYAGLLASPAAAPWLWVALLGVGQILFPLSLLLINMRTDGHRAAVALSGFVQSVGYAIAAVFPVAVGLIYQMAGSWTAPLWILMATTPFAAVAGLFASRNTTIEDESVARTHP